MMPASLRGQTHSSLGGMPPSGAQECYWVTEALLPMIQNPLSAHQGWEASEALTFLLPPMPFLAF